MIDGWVDNNIKNIFSFFIHHFPRFAAFTLAEVLIVIGIIGIVAEMTIPSLVSNVQDNVYKSSFKKTYSTISQSILYIIKDYGLLEGQFNDNDTFTNLFKNYFSVMKSCADGDSSCWTCNGQRKDDYFLNGKSVKATTWWYLTRPTLVLKDGTMLNFAYISSTCTGDDNGLITGYQGTLCGGIFVDVNGCKKPNKWGRDLFNIEIQKNRAFALGPSNNNNDNLACDKDSTHTAAGFQCAENVLNNIDY